MRRILCLLCAGCWFGLIDLAATVADDVVPSLTIDSPMSPPGWALLQRELLQANADACEEFYNRYFDERGVPMMRSRIVTAGRSCML